MSEQQTNFQHDTLWTVVVTDEKGNLLPFRWQNPVFAQRFADSLANKPAVIPPKHL